MQKFYIHLAEERLSLKEKKLEAKQQDIIHYLEEKEYLDLFEDFILFKNFTGVLNINDTNYLIIPKKLAKEFELIDEKEFPIKNFEEKFNIKFENFLKYILKNLVKENLIYTLSISDFSVEESKPSESLIFKLLLLLNKKEELLNSFHLILSNPHKEIFEYETYKNLDETSYVDSDVVVDIVQNPEKLYETNDGILDLENKRYSPISVLQYEKEETFNTPENRFLKFFLKEIQQIISDELKDFLFLQDLKQIKEEVEYFLQSDIFSDVEDLIFFTSNSQVLMKKAGYREIFQFYRLFHLSFVPSIFKDLDMAFSLKDMATLWEYYVLIEILKSLKNSYGNYKTIINFEEKTEQGTIYDYAEFEFENGIKLYFQKSLNTYSKLKFRPDFIIEKNGKRYIFDAKFRIFEDNKKDILQNMHYYKDALKVEFALAVCLGNEKSGELFNQHNEETYNIQYIEQAVKDINFKGVGYFTLDLEIE